eukprot:TRINITY_DN12681_c0_g1_i1.p1 TRINITY_DN12681_c0_g1~~TRINITY_DN12681_c0_g1_i1.p1  ORF type:complete len:191 (+),score=37.72 TRINITY_DN12681_c0_g1_i1:58-630(+)
MSLENKKKPFKVVDRLRSGKKGIMAASLQELLTKAKSKFSYPDNQEVELVLDEDGTEIDDDDYLFSLPDNVEVVILYKGDRWNPFNVGDEVDNAENEQSRLTNILLKLESCPGSIGLLSEPDFELLVDIDPQSKDQRFQRFDPEFLKDVQTAAHEHLHVKGQIRDAIGLLDIYHKSQQSKDKEEVKKRKR